MRQLKIKGSITVFLSLLLPLLMVFIGTLLEVARFHSAKAFLEETTVHAMQMMFSDYNKELWEDYHLFAFTEEEKEAKSEIARAVHATLSPGENIDKTWIQKLDFWKVKLSELSIESKETLIDENGDILKHEAIEFMKYQVAEDFIEELLKIFHIIKGTKAGAKVSGQKLETERELYNYSKEMLEFMELIDGIDFGENGVQRSVGQKIKIKSSFVKQFLYGKANCTILGLEDGIVWESLKNHYYNSKKSLEKLQEVIKDAKEIYKELEQCKTRLIELREQQRLEQKEQQKQIKDEIERLQDRIEKVEKMKKELITLWKVQSNQLKERASSIRVCVERALELIPKLETLQRQAIESVKQYKEVLEQEKEKLPDNMYQSFWEDCQELETTLGIKAEGQKKEIGNLNMFQRYLQENNNILLAIESFLLIDVKEATLEILIQKESRLQSIKQQAKNYHISEFIFPYKMVESKEKQENPIETLRKLGNKTLLSLVVKDERKISENSIVEFEKVFPEGKETGFLESISDTITKISMRDQEIFSTIFYEVSSGIPEKITNLDSLKAVGQDILQELLLNGYVQKTFYDFPFYENNKKESALRYEQEYILSGRENDRDNLAYVIKKIIAIRTVCNYLTLLSDPTRQKEAYTMAIAIAGFTGLEPLVEVLKSTILLVWAYEEGLIDTAALLQGKKLQVIKQPSMFLLSFQELLTFGKPMIQKKAESLLEDKKGLGYSEYLYLFFCIQKQKLTLYRIANMIQFNMKVRYNQKFILSGSVFGCKMKGSYFIPTVFFRLPYAGYLPIEKKGGWNIEIFSEYAY